VESLAVEGVLTAKWAGIKVAECEENWIHEDIDRDWGWLDGHWFAVENNHPNVDHAQRLLRQAVGQHPHIPQI